jgi:succinyl-CoA synthetase alpha subunit
MNSQHVPLLTKNSQILIQGITGKEGSKALSWILSSGLHVVAGVTPGKGGQTVVSEKHSIEIPVYNSVQEALQEHPGITISSIYAPPQFVKNAALEAIEQSIGTIHIFAENVPTQDTLTILETARQKNVRILGPSSIGFARTGIGAIGSMGGGSMSGYLQPDADPRDTDSINADSNKTGRKKGVAILSKSGGMANTIANYLTQHNIPQTYIVGIGGDRLIGTTYADLLPELQADNQTAAIVVIGEIGGAYEEMLAQKMVELAKSLDENNSTKLKPIFAFISGIFAETLPQGIAFGHAGAIVSKTEGTRAGKINALKAAGAQVVSSPTEIVSALQAILE